jgi:hypothetical protein
MISNYINSMDDSYFYKMKISIMLIIFLFFSVNSYSQTAYRDFKWGMSIEEVKSICPDLELESEWYSNRVSYNDFNVIGSFLGCVIENNIIRPTKHPEKNNTYFSSLDCLAFYFDNNKLRFIRIQNTIDIRSSDLIKRYGSPFKREHMLDVDDKLREELFINDQSRFVLLITRLWGKNFGYSEINHLLFIDRKWISEIFNKYFIEYKNNREQNVRNILD